MSTDDGGIDHHVFVVGIAAQQLENTLENPAFRPSVFRRAILTPALPHQECYWTSFRR
jgi:hypothetical protein